jgi:hypothetical protein
VRYELSGWPHYLQSNLSRPFLFTNCFAYWVLSKKILIFSTRIIHTYDVLFLKTTHLAVAVGQSAAEHCATRAHCCRVVEAAPTLRQPLYARVQRATRRPYRPEDIFRLRSAVRPPSDASTAARSPPRPLFDDVAGAASLAFPCSSPPPSPHRFAPPPLGHAHQGHHHHPLDPPPSSVSESVPPGLAVPLLAAWVVVAQVLLARGGWGLGEGEWRLS